MSKIEDKEIEYYSKLKDDGMTHDDIFNHALANGFKEGKAVTLLLAIFHDMGIGQAMNISFKNDPNSKYKASLTHYAKYKVAGKTLEEIFYIMMNDEIASNDYTTLLSILFDGSSNEIRMISFRYEMRKAILERLNLIIELLNNVDENVWSVKINELSSNYMNSNNPKEALEKIIEFTSNGPNQINQAGLFRDGKFLAVESAKLRMLVSEVNEVCSNLHINL